MTGVIDELLRSDEPSIRWKVRTKVLGEDPESAAIRKPKTGFRRPPQ